MKRLAVVLGFVMFLILAPGAHAQQAHSATITLTPPTVPTPGNLTFKLQRSIASSGPFTQVGNPFSGSTVTDTTVTAGTTYFWRIVSSCPVAPSVGCGTASNPMNGDSVPSASVTGTIPNDSVSPPPASNLTLTLQ